MKKTVLALLMALSLLLMPFADGEASKNVSAGHGSTYVIKADGSLWGWGNMYTGYGNGFKEAQLTPVKILDDVKSVSAFLFGGVAVKKDNTLWGWGSFDAYPFGKDDLDPKTLYPQKMLDDVIAAASGQDYILALKSDHSLWLCGDMYLGDGTKNKASADTGFVKIADGVSSMYAAHKNVYMIKDDHTLWGWGDNAAAQMGNGERTKEDVLIQTKILDDVKYVTASSENVLAIRLDNSLYGWGDDQFYTDEYGMVEDAGKPYKITDNVKSCAINGDNGFVVKTDNSLWGWGYSYQGRTVNENSLYKITDGVLDISLGERHAAVLKKDSTLWVMGGNYRKGLGYESNETWYTPLTKVIDNVVDMPADWAYEEVEKAIGEKLIPEDLQNNYTKPINRKEFCILAIRMMEVKYDMSIDDILKQRGLMRAPSNTFIDCDHPDVLAAKALGITDGTGPNTFDPLNTLTREQAAKFLSTTAKACSKAIDADAPNYSDLNDIADWAKPYTGYVYNIGVMKGVGGNKFAPKASYQRQQAFMTMYRIWQALGDVYPPNIGFIDDDVVAMEDVEDYLTYKPYEKNIKATYNGSLTKQNNVDKLDITVYYSPDGPPRYDGYSLREDYHMDDNLAWLKIYSDPADITFTRMYMFSEYAETRDGNEMLSRRLDPDYFKSLKTDSENKSFSAKFTQLNGEEVIYFNQVKTDFSKLEIWYSMQNLFPVKYRREMGTTEEDHIIEAWQLQTIDEPTTLPASLFDDTKIE